MENLTFCTRQNAGEIVSIASLLAIRYMIKVGNKDFLHVFILGSNQF